MIGLPMNFQHTAHVGSSDIAMGASHLVALQNHMQSKGGYDTAVPIAEATKLEDDSSMTWHDSAYFVHRPEYCSFFKIWD